MHLELPHVPDEPYDPVRFMLSVTPVDDQLPEALRRSSLEWTPDDEDQSPALGPEDSWTATLGTLEWSILVHQTGLERPEFLLSLRNYATDEEVGSWVLPSLGQAALAADSSRSLLLDQLRRSLRSPG